MFVSSYSTYVSANHADKLKKKKKSSSASKSFATKLEQPTSSNFQKAPSNPVNNQYSKNTFSVQQKIYNQQHQTNTQVEQNLNKFNGKNSLINAQNAYVSNSKMFSLIKTPNITLNQTPSLDNTLPKEPKDIKELNMRHKMVNAYIANDTYYKITA